MSIFLCPKKDLGWGVARSMKIILTQHIHTNTHTHTKQYGLTLLRGGGKSLYLKRAGKFNTLLGVI